MVSRSPPKKPPPHQEEKNLKRDQLEKVLEYDKFTIEELREYAISPYGLVCNDIRRRIWPILLNTKTTPKIGPINNDKSQDDEAQVQKDVERSLHNFDYYNTLNETTAKTLKSQLKAMIMELLKNNNFHYFQGYNDFCSVFLLIIGPKLGCRAAENASQFLIKDFLLDSFEKGVKPMLFMVNDLLRQEAPALHEQIIKLGMTAAFVLPWLLTWFSHTINSLDLVGRVFDFCIASSEPLVPVYLSAALIIAKQKLIPALDPGQDPDDMQIQIHSTYQQLQLTEDDVEDMCKLANELMHKIPPNSLVINHKSSLDQCSPLIDKDQTLDNHIKQFSIYIFGGTNNKIVFEKSLPDKIKDVFESLAFKGIEAIARLSTYFS